MVIFWLFFVVLFVVLELVDGNLLYFIVMWEYSMKICEMVVLYMISCLIGVDMFVVNWFWVFVVWDVLVMWFGKCIFC